MKAIKKFLALLLAAVMAFTVVPVFAAQSSSVPEKALSAGRLYGYRVFDDDDTLSYAWISFTADNPAAVTEEQVEENAFDDYTNMNCGAYVNGYVYGFAENGYFYRVNTADWSRERLFADASSYNGWSDMTFDYTPASCMPLHTTSRGTPAMMKRQSKQASLSPSTFSHTKSLR